MSAFQKEQLSLADFSKLRKAETEFKERKLPHDFTDEIPSSASLWLLRAGIDDSTRRRHGIGFSKSLNRAIVPIYGRQGELVGSIARRLEGNGPKYISNVPPRSIFTTGGGTSTDQYSVDCVITEDVLSAIRCGRFVRAIALLGTGTGDTYLGKVLDEAAGLRVGIWLDPDNAGRRATEELSRGLALTGITIKQIKSKRDPKLHSDREIQEYLA